MPSHMMLQPHVEYLRGRFKAHYCFLYALTTCLLMLMLVSSQFAFCVDDAFSSPENIMNDIVNTVNCALQEGIYCCQAQLR